MKKVFLDTNILIDYLARRGHFFEPAAQIVQLGQQHKFDLLVSAMSFATASFILEAHHKLSNETIIRKFAEFVTMCNVTPVDSLTIDEAIASRFSVLKDSRIASSAEMHMEFDIFTDEQEVKYEDYSINDKEVDEDTYNAFVVQLGDKVELKPEWIAIE